MSKLTQSEVDTLVEAATALAAEGAATIEKRRVPELDTLLEDIGPWSMTHAITLMDQNARKAFRRYLKTWWPTYLNFSDQMRVATHWRREDASDLVSDFGDS